VEVAVILERSEGSQGGWVAMTLGMAVMLESARGGSISERWVAMALGIAVMLESA
jgi:hypothetical protein